MLRFRAGFLLRVRGKTDERQAGTVAMFFFPDFSFWPADQGLFVNIGFNRGVVTENYAAITRNHAFGANVKDV
mgnify:CR=1 FL=1